MPPGVQPIVAVDMTADGARFAAGRANVVQVYDADSGLEILSLGGHKDIIQSIRFSPDGRRLAAGSYEYVTLWDVPTGGLAKTFTGHGDAIKALAVTTDGKTAYSGGLDKSIRVWSLADGKETRQIDLPAANVEALALAPDGQEPGGRGFGQHRPDPERRRRQGNGPAERARGPDPRRRLPAGRPARGLGLGRRHGPDLGPPRLGGRDAPPTRSC